ncbi:MAG TPA: hypothetical protein VIZ30_03640 [Pseudomonadales bacterium]
MTALPAKIVAIHKALESANLPHAFGGALALAWCTERARGTIDIDINVFVGASQSDAVFAALPKKVKWTKTDLDTLRRDGQVRIWWDTTPLDLFLNTTPFHDEVAARTRWERFADASIPFLSCQDIAVFKAFFNRTKDWADIEEMQAAGTLDKTRVIAVLVEYLGGDDARIDKLRALAAPAS